MTILLTAHWPEHMDHPTSRGANAKDTNNFHTLVCGVDSSKMLQVHIICEDTDTVSRMLCVLREMADGSRPSPEP